MDTFPLGPTSVRRIGFGAMQLPGPGVFGPPRDHDAAIAVLRRAVELGVNHIDTAQYYGPDVANELIREALHPYPDDLVLVSKVGAVRDDEGGWIPAQSPDRAARRRGGQPAHPRRRAARRGQPAPDARRPPARGRGAGAVRGPARRDGGAARRGQDRRHRGLHRQPRAGPAGDRAPRGIACVQNAFSLLDQSDADVLDLCHEHGHRLRAVLPARLGVPRDAQGHRERRGASSLAERIGATPAQVGLAWLLAHRDNILLIPGTSSVAHLEENLAVADVRLSPDDLAELEKVGD